MMENSAQPVQKVSDIVNALLEKLKEAQSDITLEFDDLILQGPGPQGQPGQWRINGRLSLKTKSGGQDGTR
ncbi:MAG: hypothetical protein ACO1OQ_02020 [Rufibacter sp.]